MIYGSKGTLSYTEARDTISKWMLLSSVNPGDAPPLFVYSKPGFSFINLLKDAMLTAMDSVKGTYAESVSENVKAFITMLEKYDTVNVLHALTKYSRVKTTFNSLEKSEVPMILTVTPSFLLKIGMDKIIEALERTVFGVLHVYNALDTNDPEAMKVYEAIAQGMWERLEKPVVFSQQLVPGVSKRRISLSLGAGGIAIMHVDLPTISEWEAWLKKFHPKADQDVVDFVKLITPDKDMGRPFFEMLEMINSKVYGVTDPFMGEELHVVELEGVKVEWEPVLGAGTESIPSPDAWTKVSLLPWHFIPFSKTMAVSMLGSEELVESLVYYKRIAKGALRYLEDLSTSIPTGRYESVLEDVVYVIKRLEEAGADPVAAAYAIRAFDTLYRYAENFEGWEKCEEACIALKAMCELITYLTDVGGELLRKVVEDARVVIVELTGVGAEKACAKLKLAASQL